MNCARLKAASSELSVLVPVSCYVEHCGVGYLAVGVENLSSKSLVYSRTCGVDFNKAKRIATMDILKKSTIKLLHSMSKVVVNFPEDYVMYDTGKQQVLLIVGKGCVIRSELFKKKATTSTKCAECNTSIEERDEYYTSKRGCDKEYCCECFRELHGRKLLRAKTIASHADRLINLTLDMNEMKEVIEANQKAVMHKLVEELNSGAKQLHSPSEVLPLLKSYGLESTNMSSAYRNISNTYSRIVILSAIIGRKVKEIINKRLAKEKDCKKAWRLSITLNALKEMQENNYEEAICLIKTECDMEIRERDLELLMETKQPLFSAINALKLRTESPWNTQSLLENSFEFSTPPITSLGIKQIKRRLHIISNPPIKIASTVRKMASELYSPKDIIHADVIFSLALYLHSKQPAVSKDQLIEFHTLAITSYINVLLLLF
eukprot:TRINITY_DN3736_c0_g2_i8.p1 TRINITY_DN3736_c0_g2~~TRINITY_DN3736_c0_g2_i8.p1  ORF type:complete len:434 (-),score=52.42 TRINITY_DN3736_c0_g2_i8:413-1714(-)